MEEATAGRYWCHRCAEMVNPIMEIEIKCPLCQGGFLEEMSSSMRDSQDFEPELGSDRALSLWAPIFLGMMGSSRRRRRLGWVGFGDDDDDNIDGQTRNGGEFDLDRHLESFLRRRRRSSATILQLLQGIRAGMASELENSEGERERDRDGDGERVILINPFNQTIIVQGSSDSSNGENQNQPIASLGDYFIGPGLDLLLQHLAENDPNRYGTPPAQKEAVKALPRVTISETLQCSVCLDDFEVGTEAKEMPCKHKFHSGCILPWLELHSSCPVCRFQLPADESKLDSERSTANSDHRELNDDNPILSHRSSIEEGDGEGRNSSGRWFSFPWRFNGLFSSSSSSSSQSSGSNSTSTSSANAPGSASQTDEN